MKKSKNMIRYISVLIVAALASVMLSSCSQENVPSVSSLIDDSVQYYNSGAFQFETEDGFYYLDYDGFMNFFDYASQQNVIACNKPNCKHEKWNSATPDEQKCNAYQSDIVQAGFAENGKLYILVYNPGKSITSLIRADLDCANQEIIAELESDYTRYMVIKDGMMYLANSAHLYETDEEGLPVMSGKTYTWLYSVDLENGKTTELTERELDYNASFRIISVSGDSLYIARNYFEEYFDGTNFEDAKVHEELYEYNIETGEYKRIELEIGTGNVSYRYVHDGKLVETVRESLSDETYDITLIDIITGDRTPIINDADTADMLGTDVEYGLSGQYYLYNIETGEAKEIDSTVSSELYVFSVLDEYVYGQITSDGSGTAQNVLITKEDYINGEPNYIYIETE